ncbi:hypothetical protein FB451DRAFT_174819 [Mycena latifolia]|nr:hypothetical protein FB451DRAFT_174819 [Mycena latifolia]
MDAAMSRTPSTRRDTGGRGLCEHLAGFMHGDLLRRWLPPPTMLEFPTVLTGPPRRIKRWNGIWAVAQHITVQAPSFFHKIGVLAAFASRIYSGIYSYFSRHRHVTLFDVGCHYERITDAGSGDPGRSCSTGAQAGPSELSFRSNSIAVPGLVRRCVRGGRTVNLNMLNARDLVGNSFFVMSWDVHLSCFICGPVLRVRLLS